MNDLRKFSNMMRITCCRWYTDKEVAPFLGIQAKNPVEAGKIVSQKRSRFPESIPTSCNLGVRCRRTLGMDLAKFLVDRLPSDSVVKMEGGT